jgi:hypothetical protein
MVVGELMITYLLLVAALVTFFTMLARFLAWFAGPTPHLSRDLVARLRPFRVLRNRATWDLPIAPDHETAKVDILNHTLELRRLAAEIEKARASDQPGKMLKITSSVKAYDDVLLSCCRTAGVTYPARRPPLTAAERLDAEAALLTHGIRW